MLATSSFPPTLSIPPPAPTPEVNNNDIHASASSSPAAAAAPLSAIAEPAPVTVTDDQHTNADSEQQRKKTYLSLLPPAQIIDLCLTFEQHVPLAVRASLWPVDLESVILTLQKPSSTVQAASLVAAPSVESSAPLPTVAAVNVPSQQVHPPGRGPFDFPLRPLDASYPTPSRTAEKPAVVSPPTSTPSTSDVPKSSSQQPATPGPTAQASLTGPAPQDALSQTQPQLQFQSASQNTTPAATPTISTQALQTPIDDGHAIPAHPVQSASASAPPPTPTPAPAHAPYPYVPYGYPQPPQQPYPQAAVAPVAYPHAPYYAPPVPPTPGGAPAYPYPSYPPYPSPAGYSIPPPPPPQEDLPSYETMLVEALMDMDENEGAAPKDLFIWMAQRWPLQTNFRPSASQALQKAYKRGRLEKMENGKYRLNPTYQGGETSRRTTRRPQTLAQTTYAMQHPPPPPSSPFTHTPLARGSHAVVPPQHQPYPGYTYPYPGYGGYPGYAPYPAHPPSASHQNTPATAGKTTPANKPAEKAVAGSDKGKVTDAAATATATTNDEAGDAWQAAQHILKAINFSSVLVQESGSAASPSTVSGTAGTSAQAHAQVQPVMGTIEVNANSGIDDGLGRATLTSEERASLQAQLALLAAQLSEIAELELQEEQQAEPQAHAANVAATTLPPVEQQQHRPRQASSSPQRIIIDVNQFPEELSVVKTSSNVSTFDLEAAVNSIASLAASQAVQAVEEEDAVDMAVDESDEEDDMEMVC